MKMREELTNRVYSYETINKVSQKLNYLDYKISSKTYVFLKVITTTLIFFFFLIVKNGYILAPLITIIYYFLFDYLLLDLPISAKIKKIEKEALDFFPLLLLNISGGRSIKQAIKLTTALFDQELSQKFSRVSESLKYGKSLEESLTELEHKIPSQIIGNIIISIKEACVTGNSINNSVDKQLEYLKKKNKHDTLLIAKNKPLKMLLVTFIFTSIMLLILFLFLRLQ